MRTNDKSRAEKLSGELRRLLRIKKSETLPLLWSIGLFFCLMSSYYILRPVRDAMGISGGVRNLQWLFTGTLAAMLLANPLFAVLVSKMPRERFIPIVYRFFMLNLLLFFFLLHLLPSQQVVWVARAFYVWVSVFALFAVSILWGLMADIFHSAQAKRIFGLIGIGGTLGAMAGAGITSLLAQSLGIVNLLLLSLVLLEGAVFCTKRLSGCEPLRPAARPDTSAISDPSRQTAVAASPGPLAGILDGVLRIARSPYLGGICLYMFLYTTTSTFLYFEMATLVEARFGENAAATTALFAKMDFVINSLALVTQAFLTSRIVGKLGLGLTLMLLPAITAAGFSILAVAPLLPVVIIFNVLRRATQFAIGKPTREILYTPLDRDSKYKAKSLIDTFVYRGGDALAAWGFKGLRSLSLGLAPIAWIAVPIGLLWAMLGFLLGRHQDHLSRETNAARSRTT